MTSSGRVQGGDGDTRPRADLTVACYTFPHYHRSAVNDRLYGPGWSEYVLMRGARPWFPGHHQPRQPLLGELDEREPATWERYNDIAADHGIDVFIWDWYWYEGKPAFHEALEEGFLESSNRPRMKFAVMWTNHPWPLWYPTVDSHGGDIREHEFDAPEESADVWRSMSYIISRYFGQDGYWMIDGKPVLVVYEAQRLRDRFGISGTAALLDELRAFAHSLGHDGIHFHASHGSQPAYRDIARMGFDSYGLYNSILVAGRSRPLDEELADYGELATDVVERVWVETDAESPLACFPSVSPGWDTTPRYFEPQRPSIPDRTVWPGRRPLAVGETPGAFEALVRSALDYLNDRPEIPRVLLVGCWNEWTEGQYLLPDNRFGYGMVRALARAVDRSPEVEVRPGWSMT